MRTQARMRGDCALLLPSRPLRQQLHSHRGIATVSPRLMLGGLVLVLVAAASVSVLGSGTPVARGAERLGGAAVNAGPHTLGVSHADNAVWRARRARACMPEMKMTTSTSSNSLREEGELVEDQGKGSRRLSSIKLPLLRIYGGKREDDDEEDGEVDGELDEDEEDEDPDFDPDEDDGDDDEDADEDEDEDGDDDGDADEDGDADDDDDEDDEEEEGQPKRSSKRKSKKARHD